MAVFNPAVPEGKDNMPSFLKGYSDSISQPTADKSTALAISTLGGAIEGVAGLVETTAKDIINKDVRSTVEPIREDFTRELEIARAAQMGSVVPAPARTDAGSTATSLVAPDSKTSVPVAIDKGLQKVDAVQAALVNGKINDTYYDLRLKTAVTDLRAKYPGFVDYIDQRVAQITGGDPANNYIRNLMSDINSRVSGKKTEADKILDMARRAMDTGLPGAQEQYERLKADPSYEGKFLEYYTNANTNRYSIEQDNAQRANRKGRREEYVQDDIQKFTNLVARNLDTNFNSAVTIPGVDTPQGILDFVKQAAAQPEKYSQMQYEAWAQKILIQKGVMRQQLLAESNKTEGGALSYAQSIGVQERDRIIDSQLANYDNIYAALKNKDAGLAFYHTNQARAYLDQNNNKLLQSDVGRFAATSKFFLENMGPNWVSLTTNAGLRNNIDQKMRATLDESLLNARAQPNFDASGKPITFQDHAKHANELEQKGLITAQMKARYYNNLVNVVDDITNKEAPEQAKLNAMRYLFDPANRGMLANFKTDYTDPTTGKFVPGKYAVFSRMTSEDVVSEVAKMAKKDPTVGRNFKNWMENEAGSQLFYKDMQNLNRYTGHDDLHFTYNNGEKGNGVPFLTLTDKNGTPLRSRPPIPGTYSLDAPAKDPGYLYGINQTVERINGGLAGLSRVEKALGGDVNSYILNFLQRSQVDLGKNWEGLPQKLMDAIAASRAPAKKIEDTFKQLRSE